MSRLVAGWAGELGWELMMFQGHIRTVAKDFNEVCIISRLGHEVIYQDFCTEFIPFSVIGNLDCELCDGDNFNTFFQKFVFREDTFFPVTKFPMFTSCDDGNVENFWNAFNKQTFIKYGTSTKENQFDIIIHARSIQKPNPIAINWEKENWEKVANHFKGLKIASIGTSTGSFYIEGTENYRDVELSELVDILASSKILIGSSSGPMHLGSLCGIKHMVIARKTDISRYKTFWNPFKTPFVPLVDYDWNPPIDYIVKNIEEHL